MNIPLLILTAALLVPTAMFGQIQNLRREKLTEKMVVKDFSSAMKTSVIPAAVRGKDGKIIWEKAFSTDDFTIGRQRAIARARALSATGEYEKFLEKTLKPSQKTRLFLTFDDSNLYIRAVCHEEKMAKITSVISGKRDSAMVCSSDCIDMLLSPDRKKGLYYQIAADCSGNYYDAECKKIENQKNGRETFSSSPAWNAHLDIHTAKSADRWEIEMTVPFKDFAPEVREKGFFDLNILRHETAFKESSSWGPINKGFHDLNAMIRIYIGKKKSSAEARFLRVAYSEIKFGLNRFKITLSGKADTLCYTLLGKNMKKTGEIAISGQENLLSLQLLHPGPTEMQLQLFRNGKETDSALLFLQIPEPLTVQLNSVNIPALTKSIPVQVHFHVRPPSDYQVIFTWNGQETRMTPDMDCLYFDLNTEKGNVFVLKTSMTCKGKIMTAGLHNIRITKESDPFDE